MTQLEPEGLDVIPGYKDVYIGRLDDPRFSWDQGDWNHNVPSRMSPWFPSGAFYPLISRILDHKLVGKQTDWAGWVAKATKSQILDFLEELYGRDPCYSPGSPLPHDHAALVKLRAYIDTLDDRTEYALVASAID